MVSTVGWTICGAGGLILSSRINRYIIRIANCISAGSHAIHWAGIQGLSVIIIAQQISAIRTILRAGIYILSGIRIASIVSAKAQAILRAVARILIQKIFAN